MQSFTWQTPISRIVFGDGASDALGDELDRLSIDRVLILCSPGRTPLADRIAATLGGGRAAVSPVSESGMPRAAFGLLKADVERTGAEALVALGGGSPIGLAKAWAAETGRPTVAIVTTYSGSEMQNNWYIGDGPNRIQGATDAALPRTVVYDPVLTVHLPPAVSAASGMNAMAHAVETLYGPDTNPLLCTLAEDAIRRLGAALPRIVEDPADRNARAEALYAAWLATGFRATSGLEHALAQRVRSRFTLDHAACHTVAVPYAIAANAAAAPGAMRRIEKALGVADAARGLYDLNRRLGLPTGFGAIGMPAGGVDEIADILAGMNFPNPRRFDRQELRAIVAQAHGGAAPAF